MKLRLVLLFLLISLTAVSQSDPDLLLMRGEYEQAAQAYSHIYNISPGKSDLSSLLLAASIYYEIGEYERAEEYSQYIHRSTHNLDIKERSALLLIKLYHVQGKIELAQLLIQKYMNLDPGPAFMLGVYDIALIEGRNEEAGFYRGKLLAQYPASIEANMILNNPKYKRSIDPPLFFATENHPIQEPVGDAAPHGIQLASFTSKPNAEKMAAKVRESGFTVVIQTQDRNGTLYYKLITPVSESQNAEELMTRLKGAGFEGFLLF